MIGGNHLLGRDISVTSMRSLYMLFGSEIYIVHVHVYTCMYASGLFPYGRYSCFTVVNIQIAYIYV